MSAIVFLATNDETQGALVRKVLLREGLDCPISNVVRVELAPHLLPRSPVDLIVVGLPEDHDSSLKLIDWLEKVPRTNGERVIAIGPRRRPQVGAARCGELSTTTWTNPTLMSSSWPPWTGGGRARSGTGKPAS